MQFIALIALCMLGVFLFSGIVSCRLPASNENHGLINFTERTREYATLRVLDYHQKEIRRPILSGNLLISALAIAVSILPGMGFTKMILSPVESESMRYAALASGKSIAIVGAITFGFPIFIQLLLTRKVRRIDMVKALKSAE